MESKRFLMVPSLSSAARMPLPGATRACSQRRSCFVGSFPFLLLWIHIRRIDTVDSTTISGPSMSGTRWWRVLGLISRMRLFPDDAAPPACSATNRKWIGLVHQPQLAVGRLVVRRVPEYPALEQITVEVGHERADVSQRESVPQKGCRVHAFARPSACSSRPACCNTGTSPETECRGESAQKRR